MRVNSNVEGVYYQNDIEFQHAAQKCIQENKKRDEVTGIKNLQQPSDRQDGVEVRALYGAGNYSTGEPYQRFWIQSGEWYRLDENRKKDHVHKCRSFVSGKTELLSEPRNSERKPCYQERPNRVEPGMITDRHNSNSNSDKQQTSSQEEASLRFAEPRYSLLKHFLTLSFAYCVTKLS